MASPQQVRAKLNNLVQKKTGVAQVSRPRLAFLAIASVTYLATGAAVGATGATGAATGA